MPSEAAAARAGSPRKGLLNILLCGTAIFGAALFGLTGPAGAGPTMPTQGIVNLGVAGASGTLNVKTPAAPAGTTAAYSVDGAGSTADVTLTAPRTLIDWDTF